MTDYFRSEYFRQLKGHNQRFAQVPNRTVLPIAAVFSVKQFVILGSLDSFQMSEIDWLIK